MNEHSAEHESRRRVSRRSIVASGMRLAYAAPVVAASMRLSARDSMAFDYCGSCFDDALSPKRLDGNCYSCKVPEAGCIATRSNVQADDLTPSEAGGLYCRCQGTICIINGKTFTKGQDVTAGTNGACSPYLITNTSYDHCVASVQSLPA